MAKKWIWIVLLSLISIDVIAQDTGVLDGIVTSYKTAADGWTAAIKGYVFSLFWSLALLDFVWTGIKLIFRKPDINDVISEYLTYRKS
ncbi:hypothetical protein [Microbulbifer sp. SSSA005]|uniref:hypothetical protein n=1 Tax=Microbulbifer sp. SSSA005 TaxID=3243378 RepID=UPI004039308A